MSEGTKEAEKAVVRKDGGKQKKEHTVLSSYTILFIITFAIGVLTIFISKMTTDVTAASLSDILMSPIKGCEDGFEISLFLLILGGCMGMVNKIGALTAGIRALVRKLQGRELVLIPIIMAIFAILGSTYGFCEETIPFYALLSATLYAAGYDTMVATGTVLFGAGVGCLGATVDPFANGVAISVLHDNGVECNTGIIILLGVILTVMAYCVSLFYILKYAKKVKADKGSTILSLQEQNESEEAYGAEARARNAVGEKDEFTKVQKVTLILFGVSFLVMILGFIPWEDFGVNIFTIGGVYDAASETWTTMPWSGYLTGNPIGEWYFNDATEWFLIMAVIIGVVGKLSEPEIVDTFIAGAGEMVGVALVIGLARAISGLMSLTGLDVMVLNSASNMLQGTSAFMFSLLSYLVYLGLSIIITSTSALATVSMPIMGPLTQTLGFSPDVMVMIYVAANGLANLFSPTAVFLPGLILAKVKYPTYLKWALKPILIIAVLSVVILTAAMMIL